MAKKSVRPSMSERLYRLLASQRFFWGIWVFAVLSAVWVAISSLYPMAFDEDFHLGMIRLYAEHWGPFSLTQTSEANVFGSVVTDPSYLYHYLMSFPYRLLEGFGASETAIVIILRLLNVAMFGLALWLYHKVLLSAKVSSAVTNAVLMVFVLVPVVPLLAGQINYDNLLLVIVAMAFLLAIRIRESLRSKNMILIPPLFWLILLLAAGTVVKYAFLPIAVGIAGYVAYEIVRVARHDKNGWMRLWVGVKKLPTHMKYIFAVLFVIVAVLFGQRYGTNLVKYHDPVPDCGAVLSVEQCMPYGPWGRDYSWAQTADQRETKNAVGYTVIDWAPGMWRRLYFAIAGPGVGYDTQKPLPIPSVLAIVVVLGGVLLLFRYGRRIFREYPVFWLFVIPSVLYIFAVWQQVYKIYIYTAWPMAINGRYLLPLLPLLGAILAMAYVKFFRELRLARQMPIVAAVVLVLFLYGGGVFTYVVRSQPGWFWQDSWMQTANDGLRDGLKPILYEGGGWFSYRGGP